MRDLLELVGRVGDSEEGFWVLLISECLVAGNLKEMMMMLVMVSVKKCRESAMLLPLMLSAWWTGRTNSWALFPNLISLELICICGNKTWQFHKS